MTWKPLCSHLPLKEAIRGDLSMTEEELEFVAATRKERQRQLRILWRREHRLEMNAVQAARKRARIAARNAPRIAAEEARHLAAQAEDQKAAAVLATSFHHVAHNNERQAVNEIAERTRNKAKAQARFRCEPCDKNLATQCALDKHDRSQEHRDKMEGVQRPERTRYADNTKAARAANKASGQFVCVLCGNKTFIHQHNLDRHRRESKKHIRLAAEAALL